MSPHVSRGKPPEAATADILLLHVTGGADPRHPVDRSLLDAIKAGAILYNTARGSIADEAAPVDTLDGGRLAAVRVDGYAREPSVRSGLLAHRAPSCCRIWAARRSRRARP